MMHSFKHKMDDINSIPFIDIAVHFRLTEDRAFEMPLLIPFDPGGDIFQLERGHPQRNPDNIRISLDPESFQPCQFGIIINVEWVFLLNFFAIWNRRQRFHFEMVLVVLFVILDFNSVMLHDYSSLARITVMLSSLPHRRASSINNCTFSDNEGPSSITISRILSFRTNPCRPSEERSRYFPFMSIG